MTLQFTHTVRYLQLSNNSLSLHELADLENEYENETISYNSDHKYGSQELSGILEDAINQDRPDYACVRVSYAEYLMQDTEAFALAF